MAAHDLNHAVAGRSSGYAAFSRIAVANLLSDHDFLGTMSQDDRSRL